ncbi:MAG: acyltransferase family protein [Clostridiales bacterium]|nr:acyltransferase family protein [Clostridiales bacterium]
MSVVTSPSPPQGRLAKWDNLKAVLIFLVVFAHLFRRVNGDHPIMAGVFFFIYLFHMPAFLFVSGLFSKSAVKKHNYDRVFSFFLVYLVTKFLLWFTDLLLADDLVNEMPYTNLFREGGVAWYGLAMCIFLLMTMFLERYRTPALMAVFLTLGCLAGYCKDVDAFLSLSRILVFYPFFLAGYALMPEQILRVTEHWYSRVLSAAVLVAACWLCLQYREVLTPYTEFLKGKTNFSILEDLAPYGGLLRLAFYGVAFLLTFCLIAVIPNCHIPVVSTVGRRTLPVYMFHYALVSYFYTGFVLKDWVLVHFPTLYGLAYAVISLLIVLVFAAKPFDWLATKLTVLPLQTKSKQKGSGDL